MNCELGVLAAAVNYGTSTTDGMCTSCQSSAFAFNHNEITTTATGAKGYLCCLVNCVHDAMAFLGDNTIPSPQVSKIIRNTTDIIIVKNNINNYNRYIVYHGISTVIDYLFKFCYTCI